MSATRTQGSFKGPVKTAMTNGAVSFEDHSKIEEYDKHGMMERRRSSNSIGKILK